MPPLRSAGCVDPGWEHGVAQDEKKKKVKCNYCGKVVSGGIFRLKQHLARISGEVTHCERASEEVCLSMRRNLEGCRSGRKRKQDEYDCQYKDAEEANASYKHKGKKVTGDKNLVIRFAPLRSLGYVDPGWEHCVAQDDKKKRVKCNYCEKIISGGINRFKQHLARIPGEVACCEKAPEDVYVKMKENMKWHRSGRRPRKPDTKEISAFYMQSEDEDEHEEQDEGFSEGFNKEIDAYDEKAFDGDIRNISSPRFTGGSWNGPDPPLKRSRLDSVFLNSLKSQPLSHHRQGKRKVVSNKRGRRDVVSAISKFFYHAGIPSTAANSPYFHRMLELVGQYGPGLKGPSSRLISGLFLRNEITSTRKYLEELKASWTNTGCSILLDSWKDVQGRRIVNLLVSCPRGIYFVSSVDATDVIEDYGKLFLLLDRVVDEMGEENIVQVVTEDTACFRAAGKMLEEKRKNLFWTPCAVHTIDHLLEDFLKIKWVGECFEKAKKITKFVYNATWVLNYMKKEFTGGKELLMPGATKLLTSFFTIRSLLDQRVGLKRMLQSNRWLSSRYSRSEGGIEVGKIVLDAAFWKKMQYVKKSLEPLVQVLQRINSGDSLPYAYNEMYRAMLAIKAIHGGDVRKYGPFWSVMDNKWRTLFHHPLYVAAYFLNPSYRYRPDFITHPEVIRGLNECIVRLEQDSARRMKVSMQIPEFVSAKADFGTDLAISTRTELDPASWWQQHGIRCLELRQIAIRILSQTCSSIGCEHSWSIYDQFHSRRHNSLSKKRWDDLTCVHYNLRLREPLVGGDIDDLLSFESGISENLLHDWVDGTERQLEQNDEEILYNEVDQFSGDDDENESEEKRPVEMVTLSNDLEPLEVNQAGETVTTDDDEDDDIDDEDLGFLDDGDTE
ncbi:hypothetical protein CRG98_010922 [Punica granatum]|nr:hypothetical protein CRG98_010922 [Punica granatum]